MQKKNQYHLSSIILNKLILTDMKTHLSVLTYSETHAHMHTKSHNRCLVSGVLYLYDNGLVWASAKQLSLHLSQNPSLL